MTESDVPDKELLDVLRSANVTRMTTSEIAEDVPLGRRQVLNRLNKMEGDRVEREKVSGTVMWKLPESERFDPVDPEIGPWARRAHHINYITETMVKTGGSFFVGGAVLVFILLTAAVESIAIPVVTQEQVLLWGYGLLGAGGAAAMIGAIGRLVAGGMMAYARRKFT